MTPPIAIFYHSVFVIGGKRLPAAAQIVTEQMKALKDSGLLDAASNFFVGVNADYGTTPVTFPDKATVIYNGSRCRTELRTLRILEKWLPGHESWLVLWLHSKGVTHKIGDKHSDAWRNCSMHHLVKNWRECVRLIKEYRFDSVGTHWMTGDETPPGQSIWAGNMFWATGGFLSTLPSIMEREQVKRLGLDHVESRYEAEVWIGNGPKLPKVYDLCPNWNPGRQHVKVGNCV